MPPVCAQQQRPQDNNTFVSRVDHGPRSYGSINVDLSPGTSHKPSMTHSLQQTPGQQNVMTDEDSHIGYRMTQKTPDLPQYNACV